MKNNSIEKSYLSISSPGVYLYVPSKDATERAIDLARKVNEYASELKAKYPEKIGFFASLPLPDVEATLKEIKYCFTELDPKPDGIVMMSNYYGLYLGDPVLDPVYKLLNELEVTIFEHPTTPCTEAHYEKYSYNDPENHDDITPAQWQGLNRGVADRIRPAPVIEFPMDTARTVTDILWSSVPDRYPNLSWIIPHAGGALLPIFDRIQAMSSFYPQIGANLTHEGLKNTLQKQFYFDLAGPWPINESIKPLTRWIDYTNILYGSDVPFTPWAGASATATGMNNLIEEVLPDRNEFTSVFARNAKRLLG